MILEVATFIGIAMAAITAVAFIVDYRRTADFSIPFARFSVFVNLGVLFWMGYLTLVVFVGVSTLTKLMLLLGLVGLNLGLAAQIIFLHMVRKNPNVVFSISKADRRKEP